MKEFQPQVFIDHSWVGTDKTLDGRWNTEHSERIKAAWKGTCGLILANSDRDLLKIRKKGSNVNVLRNVT